MAAHTQADIVNEFLAKEKKEKFITEKLKVPAINTHFFGPGIGSLVKTDPVRIPGLSTLKLRRRDEVADALVSLASYRPGVVGFDWDLEAGTLSVMYVDGLQQRTFQTEQERGQVVDMLNNVLKARPSILGIRWEFGKDYLELRYQPL